MEKNKSVPPKHKVKKPAPAIPADPEDPFAPAPQDLNDPLYAPDDYPVNTPDEEELFNPPPVEKPVAGEGPQ